MPDQALMKPLRRSRRPALPLLLLLLTLGVTLAAPPAQAQDAPALPAGYTRVAENDTFRLYANPATLAFKVEDKRSGYLWHSNLDEVGEGVRLNRTWTAFATSGISIDYLDTGASTERASITNAEHSIDFRPDAQGFTATLTFSEPSIALGVEVRLEADGVRVALPFDQIREADPDFRLGVLHLYPFLGATLADTVPGYLFIPDGPGTLIRFAADSKATNMFYGRYYGPDLGMVGILPFDPTVNRAHQIAYPVTGMAHAEQHAYIAVVAQGAPYAEINAHPAGVITDFNFVYNTFVYNQSYFQATNRAGAGVTTLQPRTNQFDVAVHYRFLTADDANYVGMARSYQAYLRANNLLPAAIPPGDDIGIRLEFLGAEKEPILFWFRSIAMTSVAQMQAIVEELALRNVDVVYYGWQPRGASSRFPDTLHIDRALGSRAELRAFAEALAAQGGRFYLYYDPQAALRDDGGYSARSDLAMAITNVELRGYNRNKPNYYLHFDALATRLRALTGALAGDAPAGDASIGLALDGVSKTVYSDFGAGHLLNRQQATAAYAALLAEAGAPTALYQPNAYLFGQMAAYYDIPYTNSGYIYTHDTVPFLQIALAGYVPYYGAPLNFSADLRADVLRHADFGIWPAYMLTQAATATILNTPSNWIFSSSYQQWGGEIVQTYAQLNALLAPVKGQPIVAREQLAPGVFATSYANGRQIVVNYNPTPFATGDLTVGAEDAILREVQP